MVMALLAKLENLFVKFVEYTTTRKYDIIRDIYTSETACLLKLYARKKDSSKPSATIIAVRCSKLCINNIHDHIELF